MYKMTGYTRDLLKGLSFEAFTRDIWLICLSNIIGAFGEGLYFWVFPLYIKTLQADYVQIGIVFSALYGASALTLLLGGILADRFDRKKILIMAWTPWVMAPLIYSFASNWQQLVPGAICWGASMIGVPAANAYIITSITDRKKLASVLSFVWACYSFSYIFAPSIGGYLATAIEMRWVLRIAALLTAVATGIFFFLHSQHPLRTKTREIQEPTQSQKERKAFLRKMLLWSAFLALANFFISVGRTFIPIFLNEQVSLSEFHIGLFGSINFAGVTLIGLAMGHFSDKWHKSITVNLCLVFYAVSLIPLLLVRETAVLMFAAFPLGGSIAIGTVVSSYIGTIAPENKRGLWLSVPQTLSLCAAFTAPYLAGYLYSQNPYDAFIVSLIAMPLLILLATTILKE